MNESQTRLLIQRELDGNLSQDEEVRLRRVLMVNDSAVSFRANLSQVVAAARDLELPDFVRPGDSSRLAGDIIENLPVSKSNFWDPLLDIFGNRKTSSTDPRLTRSVAHLAATTTKNSSQNANSSTAGSTSANYTKIDPAVLHPEAAREKEKTPNGLPAIEQLNQHNQYITGTHSALGGLARKLGKNINNNPTEDVGKTLANAIREKVHETLREETTHEDEQIFVEEPPIMQAPISETVVGISALAPNIVPAVITSQDPGTTVNLGSSMVLTVGTGSFTQPQAISTKVPDSKNASAHTFSEEELQWKSGAYPAVPPTAKPVQTETGPLVPFSLDQWSAPRLPDAQTESWLPAPVAPESAWVPPPTPENPVPIDPWAPPRAPVQKTFIDPWNQNQSSLAPTTQNSLPVAWAQHPVAPATRPPEPVPLPVSISVPAPVSDPAPAPVSAPAAAAPAPIPPQAAPEACANEGNAYYEPTIVPIRRNALPIDAIGERINLLFNEQAENRPPTPISEEIRGTVAPEAPASPMETDVNACLSSIGRLADVRYATNSPGTINNLGRFLLTDDTTESIQSCIDKGQRQSHARVFTLDAAMQLEALLEPIIRSPGVVGYLILGYDGLVIGNKLPHDIDVELLSGCALVIYMNSHSIMKVMGHTKLKQMVCKNPAGNMILADFGKGFLVTLTGESDAAMLARLSETIESVCCN
jgi:predicted regulator of Ras-like GTPase activity (Roadblock/LC7/MglB family)